MNVDYEAAIQDGLGHVVGRILGFFYSDDGILGSRYLEWLHGALNVLIRLFWRIGLADNVTNHKTIMCQPAVIRSGIPEEAFGRSSTGKAATYRECLRIKM